MTNNIAKRWRQLSGQDHWKGLLDPLDMDLRRYLIHYGEMAQATYDTFISNKLSLYSGSSRYARKDFFSKVQLVNGNPFKYKVTKFIYATSKITVPDGFIMRPDSNNSWLKQSNWMGYVAVATDEGKAALGRRDIVVAWRGTIQPIEWLKDIDFPMVSAPKIFGEGSSVHVMDGWYSIYTSVDPHSQFNKTSARDQVLTELKRLVEQYKSEEISITVTGHSLGASLGTLNAVDIAANGVNKRKDKSNISCTTTTCPVTAIVLASPRVGDLSFKKKCSELKDLRVFRVHNLPDIVPTLPPIASEVGEVLYIDTALSSYLNPISVALAHLLEIYLHGIAGTQGVTAPFKLEINRPLALVNKEVGVLRNRYEIPTAWWMDKNKGMVQGKDGSWKLMDHEEDDNKDL
ncbi:hypothetical protein HHK36_023567 [Tetracentron sinense]|uniref:Phospholipase A1 n=1 Tax=Tetracentron sinense TaxID=13715 RepID=A0A834YNG3_TETSI|nr:hypothetical protein HHK36_023567 [Tetracentron sinense]